MKRSRAFIFATMSILLMLLLLIPTIIMTKLCYIGSDVIWLCYYHDDSAPLIHSIVALSFDGTTVLFAVLSFLIGSLTLFLTFIFWLIAKKFGKMIIPTYLFAGLSLLLIGGSFAGLMVLIAMRHIVECTMHSIYLGVPIKINAGYNNDFGALRVTNWDLKTGKEVSILEVVFNGILIPYFLIKIPVVLMPFITFVLSLIFVKDKKQVK